MEQSGTNGAQDEVTLDDLIQTCVTAYAISYVAAYKIAIQGTGEAGNAHFAALKAMELAVRVIQDVSP